MIIVSNGSPLPSTIKGTGTTVQTYGAALNAQGSNRLNGQEFIVRASGSVLPGVASNVQLQIFASYPAGQYPNANITSASMTNNVATFNGTNSYLVGQFTTVSNIANTSLNGVVGPLISANATAFTAANVNYATLAIANISNTAQTATAAIAPSLVYSANVSPTLTVNVAIPFMAELKCVGDTSSQILTAVGSDQTVNANGTSLNPNSSTGTVVPIPGVNFAAEPPLQFTVGHIWGSSNANNAGTLRSFYLES